MIDFRIYRAAFLPALAVVVGILFSLEAPPEPPRTDAAVPSIEPGQAAEVAREIVDTAPERTPGSPGSQAVGELVAEHFSEVAVGEPVEQSYRGRFEGETVELANVVLTLPGQTDRTIAIVAGRDSARGPGATTSAASTALLMRLAIELSRSRHQHTYVLASTEGAAIGALGARELLRLPEVEGAEAALVLSSPGAASPTQPLVITSSKAANETSLELELLLTETLARQTATEPGPRSGLAELARLALPTGLGDQAVLLAGGLDAIAVGGPERPPPVSEDGLSSLSAERLDEFLRAMLATIQTLDREPRAVSRGPGAWVQLGDNLVGGGWLGFLALMLVLPAAVAAASGLASAARSGERVEDAWLMAIALAAVFVVAVVALRAVALIGLMPAPAFPFDPSLVDPSAWTVVGLVAVSGAVLTAGWTALRLLATLRPSVRARASASCALGVAGVLVAWAANPHLGLALVAVPHVPLIALAIEGPRAQRLTATALASAAALALPGLIVAETQSALELGERTAWFLLTLLTSGQLSFVAAAGLALSAGALAGAFATALADRPGSRGARGDGRRGSRGGALVDGERDGARAPGPGDADGRIGNAEALPGARYER